MESTNVLVSLTWESEARHTSKEPIWLFGDRLGWELLNCSLVTPTYLELVH